MQTLHRTKLKIAELPKDHDEEEKRLIDAAGSGGGIQRKERRWTTMLFRMVNGYDNRQRTTPVRGIILSSSRIRKTVTVTRLAIGQTGCRPQIPSKSEFPNNASSHL